MEERLPAEILERIKEAEEFVVQKNSLEARGAAERAEHLYSLLVRIGRLPIWVHPYIVPTDANTQQLVAELPGCNRIRVTLTGEYWTTYSTAPVYTLEEAIFRAREEYLD